MKIYDRPEGIPHERPILKLSAMMSMREAARHRDELIECRIKPVPEEIKKLFRDNKEEAFMEMDPSPHAYDAFVRPIKEINIDGEKVTIPKECMAVPGKTGGLGELPADLVFANTIPIKHMSIMPRLYKDDPYLDFYIIHFLDDETRNNNIFKMLSGEADDASIAWVEHLIDGTLFSSVKGWVRYYSEIVLDAGKDTFAVRGSRIYFESSENLKPIMEKMHTDPVMWYPKYTEETQVVMEVLAAWYTLQECILHDELRTFVKKAKVEKPTIRKPSKKSMNRKKYVQRYYIQLQQLFNEYDINNLENTDSDKYKKKKALWHVSGHWRHYKSGKRIFVQGYWKGVQRNSGTEHAPQVPIEISMDNFADILETSKNIIKEENNDE